MNTEMSLTGNQSNVGKSSIRKSLYIAHVNIRSLVPSFADLLDWIKMEKPDIFAVSESWLSYDIPDYLISIPGYQLYRTDRITRGGGVALYVIGTIRCKKIEIEMFRQTESGDSLETLWCELVVAGVKCLIGVFYKPPAVSYRNLEMLENFLSLFSASYSYTFILGDLNINLLVDSVESKYLLSIAQSFNLKQVIREPTRITRQSDSLIDVIFIDRGIEVIDSGTVEMYNLTDHRLIYTKLCVATNKKTIRKITYRSFKNFNRTDFDNDLRNINFEEMLDRSDSIDTAIDSLNNTLNFVFDKHAPFVSIIANHKSKPYITETLKEIIKLKKKLTKSTLLPGILETKTIIWI